MSSNVTRSRNRETIVRDLEGFVDVKGIPLRIVMHKKRDD